MHRFDEQFLLKEAQRKMRVHEARAATDDALREFRRSQPSARQRLAFTLISLATWLEPGSYPLPVELKGIRSNVK